MNDGQTSCSLIKLVWGLALFSGASAGLGAGGAARRSRKIKLS